MEIQTQDLGSPVSPGNRFEACVRVCAGANGNPSFEAGRIEGALADSKGGRGEAKPDSVVRRLHAIH